jgi:4-hydroxy-tetrahydrodipicolinate reductase
MANDLKIGILGGAGRMGQMNIRQVAMTDGCVVAGATARPGSDAVGQDAGELVGIGALGVNVIDDAAEMIAGVDVVIDFTLPDVAVEAARLAALAGAAMVAGTTLAEQAARMLGIDYDIEVLEMHHRHKIDAPSGTALALGKALATGRGVNLGDVKQVVRDGYIGARKAGDIGFATLRGGDIAGEHEIIFAADGERVTLGHKASSRQVFAVGAVRAALWTRVQPPGLYNMRHVLGFDD